MLKWSTSAQKFLPHATPCAPLRTPCLNAETRRHRRRATVANKENVPITTSTPMVQQRHSSPSRLASPLLNLLSANTPERACAPRTPERLTRLTRTRAPPAALRRHSTIGITLPTPFAPPLAGIYAATLPRFEEEYSPSAALPTGQQLAMRGLLPDAFVGNPRYFEETPEEGRLVAPRARKPMPQKRKLEQEFAKIAEEVTTSGDGTKKSLDGANETCLPSAKMGDRTLDKLIDAILDSARKEDKKKEKPRRSFNLRRRTLLKNQMESAKKHILSPSYTAGDDPASDLSFLLTEPPNTSTLQSATTTTTTTPPHCAASRLPATPAPATPPAGTPLPDRELLRLLPTPKRLPESAAHPRAARRTLPKNDSFMLDTPVRPLASKRPRRRASHTESPSKRLKVNASSYFELGLALPSIYV